MDAESASAGSWRIAVGISDWLRMRPEIRRLGTFAALPGEPDLRHLHQLVPSVELIYPLVQADQRLCFHLVTDPEALEPGSFGIMEPNPLVHPPVSAGSIDAFLCPGIAFDSAGTRLGRGAGFYDRALAEARPEAARLGVGFAAQAASALPRESHDVVMDHLADEGGVRGVTPNPAESS